MSPDDSEFLRLTAQVREAPRERLPELVGLLERLKMEAWARMQTFGPEHDVGGTAMPVSPRWISSEEAARIAGLDDGTDDGRRRGVKRIYEWARAQRWASRPTRRCLRINEAGFRAWLASRA